MSENPAEPFGWLPHELAQDGPPPVIIQDVTKHGARSRKTAHFELVLVDAREDTPARLVLSNLYTGHSEAWNLPAGVRLVAETTEQET
jgi:hypothetical protein